MRHGKQGELTFDIVFIFGYTGFIIIIIIIIIIVVVVVVVKVKR